MKNKLLAYHAKKYILLGLLADCAGDDMVKAKMDLEKYSNIDCSFDSSNEGVFVKKIFEAIDSNDSELLSNLCAELDRIIPLDKIQVSLLSEIKKSIDNGFGNGGNEGNDNNNTNSIDGELDLS